MASQTSTNNETTKDLEARLSVDKQEGNQPKSLRFKLTVFFLCTIGILAAMDSVIVGACLPAIAAGLKSSSAESFWFGTSFLLAQTVVIPIYGTMSEIFGRKWPILTAVFVFMLGSILCATAKTSAWLIGARTVQGLGAGGMFQLVSVIVSDITTMSERGLYMAFLSLSWAVGISIGIPIGGAIGTYTTWRWIFWINIPICIISIVGLYTCLHLQQDPSSLAKKLVMIDWLGLSIFTCASTLFLVGITSGGVSHPWGSAKVLAPLIIGALLYLLFIYIEWRVAVRPMMPLRIFKNRSAFTGFATSYFQGMVLWCLLYYLIVFYLGATQHSLLHSAAETMSSLAFQAPAGIVASIIVKQSGRFKYVIVIGWGLLVAGIGSNVTMQPDSSKAVLYAPRCLATIGAGILLPTPLFAVQARQRGEDVGVATSVQVFFRSIGSTFGVGLGGVIFQNEWSKIVARDVLEKKIPKEMMIPSDMAEAAYEIIRKFPEAVQETYRWVYSDSLKTVWWVMMGMSIVGFLISLTARDDEVRGGLSGSQNFQDKEKKEGAENGMFSK